MMSVDIMMSLIFRCRHHDESEHNDGRVSPLVNKGEPHFANTILWVNIIFSPKARFYTLDQKWVLLNDF
jgi:hypothetical protein